MAYVHDWHKPEPAELPKYFPVEALWRVDPDGILTLRFMDRQGRVFSVSMSAEETDRLAEFLWTDRK